MVFARPALLLVAVTALAGAAPPQPSQADASSPARAAKAFPPMLGISYDSHRGTLAWFDRLTLRTRPGRKAPLRNDFGSWAFSADRTVLATATCSGGPVQAPPSIRFVNARTMRVLGDLRLSPHGGCGSSLTWLRSDRLLAVVHAPGGVELAVVDPLARRLLARRPLPSRPSAVGRSRDKLVLLLSSFGEITQARLAVVDTEGVLRVATVERVLEGTIIDEEREHHTRTIRPGLAVDPDGRRAFLVPASGDVAEIDLRTLGVSYHELHRPSALRRLLGWLAPSAHAKGPIEGPERHARWLGDGKVAVSGIDWSLTSDGDEASAMGIPAGLRLIDTRSWTTTLLSPEPIDFVVGPGLMIVREGRELVAFGSDGRERWRLRLRGLRPPSEYGWIAVAGRLGYVHRAEGFAQVIDMATAEILGTIRRDERRNPWPQLLAAQNSDW
jgi:hypothetical protein